MDNHWLDCSYQFLPSMSTVCFVSTLTLTSDAQFTCMFTTVAGGYEFSKRLGVEPGPGKANWMAAAYGSVSNLTVTDLP
jgi:hypothetical protein